MEQNMTAARRAVGDQSVVLSWEEATSPPSWWVVVTFSRANNDSGSPILVDNGLLSLTCLVQAK